MKLLINFKFFSLYSGDHCVPGGGMSILNQSSRLLNPLCRPLYTCRGDEYSESKFQIVKSSKAGNSLAAPLR